MSKNIVSKNLVPKKLLATGLAVITLSAAPLALSHLVKEEAMQSYRQSYFTLIAMNFGPMAAMVKGDMPWDDDKMLALAEDFAAVASVDVARAFGPGSDKGTTRAKPEIWENTDDFLEKYAALQSASEDLLAAAKTGDRGAIGGAIKDTGGACKACHDEYKAKDYLY
ncbi:c-type cytochrome [Congregibacter sp.]|uniref:c-type cytochrome n=1 Tax=Congregibacter sp. TaxID=2744308 RepID=UPI003F6C6262